jgi:hypothetical protein
MRHRCSLSALSFTPSRHRSDLLSLYGYTAVKDMEGTAGM